MTTPVEPEGENLSTHVVPTKPDAEPKSITMTPAQLEERLNRERAKFADYDDLKTRLSQIEEAGKSELQKAVDRATQAEQRAALAESQALRSKVQATYGISDDDAALFLTGADEATLDAQAKRLSERAPKAGTNYVSGEGRTPPAGEDDATFASLLFSGRSD